MKTNFSFKVIFFIPGNELSNSVEAFLVLFHFITILLQKKYRVAQVAQVAQVQKVPRLPRALQVPQSADPKF